MFNTLSCARLVLDWYDHHQRTLPWRAKLGEIPNPYHVLLSEIMLQQTQVATVIPYFNRFIEKFPTIDYLASASLDQVMTLWTGLGYYSRCRNLHRCAQQIMEQGGVIPQTIEQLKSLAGIGDYTSSAIASIAFNVPVVPVDGNVERVTARLFAVDEPLPTVKPKLAGLAKTLNQGEEAHKRPGDFAQALFDIGATICKPKNPLCLLCPLQEICKAHQCGIAETLPKRLPKAVKPIKYGVYFGVQSEDGKILFQKRPMKGMLAGTLELPGTIWREEAYLQNEVDMLAPYSGEWKYKCQVKHVFTHFTLMIDLYQLSIVNDHVKKINELWYDPKELEQQPCSTLLKKCLTTMLEPSLRYDE